MSRATKAILGGLITTCLALVLKKLMIPGASVLLYISCISLALLFAARCIQSFVHFNEQYNAHLLFPVSYFSFTLASVCFLLQSMNAAGIDWLLKISFILLLLVAVLLIYHFIFRHTHPRIERKIFRKLIIPFLFFLFLITFSAFTTRRQFHNFFRGTTFETYTRAVYPEDEAQKLLDANRCVDSSCYHEAITYYNQGMHNDSLKKYDEAFDCYNQAVDKNIYFAEAYVARASNRMLYAYVDGDIIRAAIRDCNVALHLKPGYLPAYIRRGFTYFISKQYNKACRDLKKAKELDSSLQIDQYIRQSCGS